VARATDMIRGAGDEQEQEPQQPQPQQPQLIVTPLLYPATTKSSAFHEKGAIQTVDGSGISSITVPWTPAYRDRWGLTVRLPINLEPGVYRARLVPGFASRELTQSFLERNCTSGKASEPVDTRQVQGPEPALIDILIEAGCDRPRFSSSGGWDDTVNAKRPRNGWNRLRGRLAAQRLAVIQHMRRVVARIHDLYPGSGAVAVDLTDDVSAPTLAIGVSTLVNAWGGTPSSPLFHLLSVGVSIVNAHVLASSDTFNDFVRARFQKECASLLSEAFKTGDMPANGNEAAAFLAGQHAVDAAVNANEAVDVREVARHHARAAYAAAADAVATVLQCNIGDQDVPANANAFVESVAIGRVDGDAVPIVVAREATSAAADVAFRKAEVHLFERKRQWVETASEFQGKQEKFCAMAAVVSDAIIAAVNAAVAQGATPESVRESVRPLVEQLLPHGSVTSVETYNYCSAAKFQALFNDQLQYERFDVWMPTRPPDGHTGGRSRGVRGPGVHGTTGETSDETLHEEIRSAVGDDVLVQSLIQGEVWWTKNNEVKDYYNNFGGHLFQAKLMSWHRVANTASRFLSKIVVERVDCVDVRFWDVCYERPGEPFVFVLSKTNPAVGKDKSGVSTNRGETQSSGGEGVFLFQAINAAVRRLSLAPPIDDSTEHLEGVTQSRRATVAYTREALRKDASGESGLGIVHATTPMSGELTVRDGDPSEANLAFVETIINP